MQDATLGDGSAPESLNEDTSFLLYTPEFTRDEISSLEDSNDDYSDDLYDAEPIIDSDLDLDQAVERTDSALDITITEGDWLVLQQIATHFDAQPGLRVFNSEDYVLALKHLNLVRREVWQRVLMHLGTLPSRQGDSPKSWYHKLRQFKKQYEMAKTQDTYVSELRFRWRSFLNWRKRRALDLLQDRSNYRAILLAHLFIFENTTVLGPSFNKWRTSAAQRLSDPQLADSLVARRTLKAWRSQTQERVNASTRCRNLRLGNYIRKWHSKTVQKQQQLAQFQATSNKASLQRSLEIWKHKTHAIYHDKTRTFTEMVPKWKEKTIEILDSQKKAQDIREDRLLRQFHTVWKNHTTTLVSRSEESRSNYEQALLSQTFLQWQNVAKLYSLAVPVVQRSQTIAAKACLKKWREVMRLELEARYFRESFLKKSAIRKIRLGAREGAFVGVRHIALARKTLQTWRNKKNLAYIHDLKAFDTKAAVISLWRTRSQLYQQQLQSLDKKLYQMHFVLPLAKYISHWRLALRDVQYYDEKANQIYAQTLRVGSLNALFDASTKQLEDTANADRVHSTRLMKHALNVWRESLVNETERQLEQRLRQYQKDKEQCELLKVLTKLRHKLIDSEVAEGEATRQRLNGQFTRWRDHADDIQAMDATAYNLDRIRLLVFGLSTIQEKKYQIDTELESLELIFDHKMSANKRFVLRSWRNVALRYHNREREAQDFAARADIAFSRRVFQNWKMKAKQANSPEDSILGADIITPSRTAHRRMATTVDRWRQAANRNDSPFSATPSRRLFNNPSTK